MNTQNAKNAKNTKKREKCAKTPFQCVCLHISTKIQNLNRPTPYLNVHTFIYIYSMNLFHYYLEYRVLVCKSCQYAIRPNHLVAHLHSDQHKLSQQQSEEIANQYKDYDLADPSMEIIAPQITTTPINYLAIYRDGLQ